MYTHLCQPKNWPELQLEASCLRGEVKAVMQNARAAGMFEVYQASL